MIILQVARKENNFQNQEEYTVKVKLSTVLSELGLILLIGSAFTYELIRALIGDRAYITLVACGTLCIVLWGLFGRTLNKIAVKKFLPWVVLGFFSLWRNAEVSHGIYNTEILFILYLLSALILSGKSGWQNRACKVIEFFGSIHVFATLILFVFRGLYGGIVPLWNYYPSGTDNGAAGYRAALTTHYSQNATYIVLVLLVVGSRLLCMEKNKRSKKDIAWFFLILFALLLTSKRGHLIFGLAALVVVFYTLNPLKKDGKISKLIIGGFGLVVIITIIFQIMPNTFEVLLGRFVNNGYDDVTSGRIPMWMLAISLFLKQPFLGIGWSGYKYQYMTHIWAGYNPKTALLNTHNVYLQLLCETGIVGFVVFLAGVILHLRYLLKLNRDMAYNAYNSRETLAVSYGMAVLFLMYSVTGCCLYDLTFHIYIICVAMGLALKREDETKR